MTGAIRAVLFDMDGTLFDSLAEIAGAVNRALEEHGFSSQPVEAYRHFVGDGLPKTIERAIHAGGGAIDPLPAELPSLVTRYYEESLASRGHPYPGIPELLDALVEGGVLLAVCSNKPHWALQILMERRFKGWPFVAARGASGTTLAKPDPSSALEIARIAGVLPSECAFVGDSDVDMETACRAGMLPVGVTWGYRGEEELREAGAVALVNHPGEIWDLIAAPEAR